MSQEGYDRAMQTLLHLDFANLDVAARSTTKWVAEVVSISGLAGDWAIEVVGTAVVTSEPNAIAPSAASMNGNGAVNDLGGMVRKKRKAVDESTPDLRPTVTEPPAVNMLSAGAVRKKPKPAKS